WSLLPSLRDAVDAQGALLVDQVEGDGVLNGLTGRLPCRVEPVLVIGRRAATPAAGVVHRVEVFYLDAVGVDPGDLVQGLDQTLERPVLVDSRFTVDDEQPVPVPGLDQGISVCGLLRFHIRLRNRHHGYSS